MELSPLKLKSPTFERQKNYLVIAMIKIINICISKLEKATSDQSIALANEMEKCPQ
jgi:hypothetical protein